MSKAPQPFYQSPDATVFGRRILLLTYSFPPDQAIGALRWQKFSSYLAKAGWGLDVVTRDPGEIERLDPSRLRGLAGVRIFAVTSQPGQKGSAAAERLPAPFGVAAKLMRDLASRLAGRPRNVDSLSRHEIGVQRIGLRQLARWYFAALDHRYYSTWADRAARVATQIFDPRQHQLVASSGPPHVIHTGALRVAKACRIPLLVDMRDPWSLLDRLPESVACPLWYFLARRCEHQIMDHASLVVMNTREAEWAMRHAYPASANRLTTVMNGCDADEPLPSRSRYDAAFRITFTGSIYFDRTPRMLFRAAAKLVRELALQPDQFCFEFVGHVQACEGRPLEVLANEEGLAGFIRVHPPVTRSEARAVMANATMLLSLPCDCHLAIPAKLFEYMKFPAWLLAMAEEGTATANALEGSGADVVDPSDVDGMYDVLRDRYAEFRQGIQPVPIAEAGLFGREQQAELLLTHIARLTAAHEPSTHEKGRVLASLEDQVGSSAELMTRVRLSKS